MIADWKRKLVTWNGANDMRLMIAMVLPLTAAVFNAKRCSRMVCAMPLFHEMGRGFIGRPDFEERKEGSHA